VTPPRTRTARSATTGSSGGKKAGSKGSAKQPAKTPTKQASTKKTTKKATKKVQPSATSERPGRRSASAPKAAAQPRPQATHVARRVAEQLAELIRKDPGEVTQLARTDDGWSIHVEVLELRRVPDTMDMLALYEVTADDRGAVEGYRRLRRYVRGVPGEE
jgi:hypothetical protein